jgi:AraC-like DNA-binding protein
MMWVVNMIDDRRQASGARSCTTLRADEEVVTAWRTSGQASLLWMRGVTTSYRVDPLGEYIIGVAERGSFLLRRRSTSRRVGAGDLVVLDPGSCHQGSTTDGSGWHARLVVVELSRLRADLDIDDRIDLELDEPVLRDPELARGFTRLHRLAERCAPDFLLEGMLAELIAGIAHDAPARRQRRPGSRRAPSIRPALERLHGDIAHTASLDELAALTGMSRYALVRRFRAEVGLPPHTYQIALRVQRARRLIEAGIRPAEAAAQAGFTDQSHLHRHFRRSGMTPATYARSIERGLTVTTPHYRR